MTRRQIKVCKNVRKYKRLNVVLKKSKITDYLEIQDILGYGNLDFSDDQMNDNTTIFLDNALTEELERRQARAVDVWFTRILATAAIIISVIALLGEIGLLQLK